MKYERIRKINNSCDNSGMRDVFIDEIECDNIDEDAARFCTGTNVTCEKITGKSGTVFYIQSGGLSQQIAYNVLDN